jgi:hypothetical protein
MKKILFKWLFVSFLIMAGFTLSWAGPGDVVIEGKTVTQLEKLIKGDTSVETIDTGDGYIVFTEDGAEVGRFTGGDFTVGTGGDPADSGTFRLKNADSFVWEASPAGTDIVGILVDANEAVQIGSAGATAVELTTDGTGTAEIVLPTGSIDSTEILDDTILEVDFNSTNAPTDNYLWSYDSASGGGTWVAAASGSVPAGSQGNMLIRGASAWLAEQVEFNPDMYAGTDTQKIQAAISAADAVGGTVHIVGSWTVTGQITVDGPCTIYGDGNNGGTTINTTNSNFVVFYINTVNTVNIRDLKIIDSGTPTAGAAIKVEYTGGSYNQRSTFSNLIIYNQYDGIDFVEAYGWRMDSCYVADCKRYGVRVRNTAQVDNATAVIDKCIFAENYSNQTAAIRYESGGGLHLVNSKIIGGGTNAGHTYGFHLVLASGATTGDLIIANNSFENLKTWHIYITTADATGVFHDIQINTNQFASWSSSTGDGINIDTLGANTVYGITMVGNTFDNCGITTTDGENILINSNLFNKGTGSNITYAINNTGATYVRMGMNIFPGYALGNRSSGAFHDDLLVGATLQIVGANPGFWLDETGVGDKGAYCVLGALNFQVQRRAQNFGAYEATPFQVNLTTGNGTFLGTVTASCGTLTCDYVFEKDYDLMPLDALQEFVKNEKELPGMTINEGGSYSTAMLREELVEKAEEQALYILQLHERLKTLEARLN